MALCLVARFMGSFELLVKADAIANRQNVNSSFQKSQNSLITKSSE
jgi:hypothetical protein